MICTNRITTLAGAPTILIMLTFEFRIDYFYICKSRLLIYPPIFFCNREKYFIFIISYACSKTLSTKKEVPKSN